MNRKTLLAAALAAGSLMGIASVAQATPAIVAGTGPAPYGSAPYYSSTPVYGYPGQNVIVQTAPPAPIYEAVPAPREGYIWAPGHYAWDNGRYIWRGGEWVASRPGYAWQAAHWEQRNDGSWFLVGGSWVATDNVATYNDGRRGPWGDRDGDGVINRDDRYPRDPGRY
jgi:hypothetical protein